uniref:Uncharacterized protein n=1 Tax=Panagrolaimus sp. PS1159 TaxID=55785 RepID=A0AC35FG96_9BILA
MATKKYTKDELSAMIKKKSKLIELVEKEKTTEKHKVFEVSVLENGKKAPTNFIQCKICEKLLVKEGGHLKTHLDKCYSKKRPAKQSIGAFMGNALSSSESKQITDTVGRYALEAGISFYRCGQPEMKRLVTDLVNIGARHGAQITSEGLTFDRKSVKNSALSTSAKRIHRFKPILKSAAENGEICFALDHG